MSTVRDAPGDLAECGATPKPLRVLIVEDEAISALCFEDAVQDLGHIVVETADGAARAVQAAERHRPDLVLMDVRLRNGDGIEAAKAIRDNWDIPSIFITANSDPLTIGRTRAARPLLDPLIKPVSPTLIRYVLDHAAALLAGGPAAAEARETEADDHP